MTVLVTLERLIAAGIRPTQARVFAEPLRAALPLHGIDTLPRVAAFIAQTGHESAGFSDLEEDLFYRDPVRIAQFFPSAFRNAAEAVPYASRSGASRAKQLANRAYAHRNGNGNEASGDGWRYRGRGLIQLTGRGNYAQASADAARDWLGNPDALLEPTDAVLASCVYWVRNRCSEPADASDIDAVTRIINKGMAGKADRRHRFESALTAFR